VVTRFRFSGALPFFSCLCAVDPFFFFFAPPVVLRCDAWLAAGCASAALGTIREPIAFTPGDSKTCHSSLAQQVVATSTGHSSVLIATSTRTVSFHHADSVAKV